MYAPLINRAVGQMPATQVGNVHSNALGSAARFNSGKPDIGLIPLGIIASTFYSPDMSLKFRMLFDALRHTGTFQMGGDPQSLKTAMNSLGNDFDEAARVFEYGKHKYAAWNWAKGQSWSIPIACIGRHALKIFNGEEVDQESGFKHTGHIMCNLIMLDWFVEHYPEGDDRYKGTTDDTK